MMVDQQVGRLTSVTNHSATTATLFGKDFRRDIDKIKQSWVSFERYRNWGRLLGTAQ
jgi:hypothetical protein